MYQTYDQKVLMMARTMQDIERTSKMVHSKEFLADFEVKFVNLAKLHNILQRSNVSVIPAPQIRFDLETLSIVSNSEAETRDTTIVLEVGSPAEEFPTDKDHHYFFYSARSLPERDWYRFAKVKMELLQPFVDRFESIRRMNEILNSKDLEKTRKYVKSKEFEKDLTNSKQNMKSMMTVYRGLEAGTSSEAANAALSLVAGLGVDAITNSR